MDSISSILPAPRNERSNNHGNNENDHVKEVLKQYAIPKYGERQNFRPTSQQDFGDGGAYPEIHVAQYPLDMGRKDKPKSENTLALQVDSEGRLNYDAIAKQGHEPGRIVQTSYQDLVPLRQREKAGDISLSRPSEEEVKQTTKNTKSAIDKILASKIQSSKSKPVDKKPGQATYVRYTPSNMMGESSDKNNRQRIIKMVDAEEDPLAPPKFKHKKVPVGPPSPPPPVLRSPPRKLTAKDQEEWYIPPSVSNWKNPKGFTIALDKRVAADGRGQANDDGSMVINDNKAQLAEALYAADRSAREEIRQRSTMQQKLAEKEQAAKEERLSQLAKKAREERQREAVTTGPDKDNESQEISGDSDTPESRRRAEMRAERKKEREREFRLSRMGNERKIKTMTRDSGEDRDVSEKVALGLAKPTKPSGESQFDSRLFSQVSSAGTSNYNEDQIYDKSLFSAREAVQSIYRPRGGAHGAEDDADKEMSRFANERRFQGLGTGGEGGESREGPVEFEKDEDDPFGINKMVKDVQYGLEEERASKRQKKD